ncbi:MAG TPA: isoprenylcysteine carboxylmethyltransferase family protein [Gemmatimonadaceae bacterium]
MANHDLLIYAVHIAFWSSFGLTRLLTRGSTVGVAPEKEVVADHEQTGRFSRLVLGIHMAAFGLMYFGLGASLFPNRVPLWFVGQRIAGTLVMAIGAALMCWAVAFFHSWRFRAKLDEGHQLATDGPFKFLRHPIYMGLNLLALGTAIWVPTPIMWVAAVLMAIGSDLRARSEEPLLVGAFGRAYIDYRARTSRFMPGVY